MIAAFYSLAPRGAGCDGPLPAQGAGPQEGELMAKRKPYKREAMLAAVNTASAALSNFYRRDDVGTEDIRVVLRLRIVRGGE